MVLYNTIGYAKYLRVHRYNHNGPLKEQHLTSGSLRDILSLINDTLIIVAVLISVCKHTSCDGYTCVPDSILGHTLFS